MNAAAGLARVDARPPERRPLPRPRPDPAGAPRPRRGRPPPVPAHRGPPRHGPDGPRDRPRGGRPRPSPRRPPGHGRRRESRVPGPGGEVRPRDGDLAPVPRGVLRRGPRRGRPRARPVGSEGVPPPRGDPRFPPPRVPRGLVFLAGPWEGSASAEGRVRKALMALRGRTEPWLEEHRALRLPREAEVRGAIPDGWNVERVPNVNLNVGTGNRLLMGVVGRPARILPSLGPLLDRGRTYRVVFVLRRAGDSIIGPPAHA